MIKASILDFRSYQVSLKNSVKSKWTSLLILFPAALYFLYLFFDSEIVAAMVSVFPMDAEKSVGFYRDLIWLSVNETIWITGYFALAWVLAVYLPVFRAAQRVEIVFLNRQAVYASVIICSSFLISILVARESLQQFPNSSDEYVYLYQASTISKGKLWETSHDLKDPFYFNHIKQKDGISVGRFPPGWPAILSIAYYFGFPAYLINPVLGLIALALFYNFAKRYFGTRVAMWSLLTLAISSFFIFNSASYFSHTSCLLFTVIFVDAIYLYRDTRKVMAALCAGFFLGMIAITRYYTALLIFVPFLISLMYEFKLKSFTLFAWMCIGSIPCLSFLFWYNYSITGDSLLPVTMWGYDAEGLGFVQGHTMLTGIEHLIRRTLMFLYWCSPGLLILYIIFLARKVSLKNEILTHPEDYIFATLVIGYFFYHEIGGNQYGPRFYFEGLPFLILFVVRSVFQLRINWALALMVAGILYAAVKMPFIADREEKIITERKDLYDLVEQTKISNAVVFVSSPTGVKRPMPAGDLTRNDPYFQNDVLYVRDLGPNNKLVMEYYPDRRFYRYRRDRESPRGKLFLIRP
jgi:hypothetical protein